MLSHTFHVVEVDYICLLPATRLVVQRTKRVDESQDLLLAMLEDLTSGTEEEKQSFMKSCVETLNQFSDSDLITPIFVFERLCNIIHPVSSSGGVEAVIHTWIVSFYRRTMMLVSFSCPWRRTLSRKSSYKAGCRAILTHQPHLVWDLSCEMSRTRSAQVCWVKGH